MNHYVNLDEINDKNNPRSSVGTSPWIPTGTTIPNCSECGESMLLFLQIELEEKHALPFYTGSQLVVCMCPGCNEIPSFDEFVPGKLEDMYWDNYEGHFFIAMYTSGRELVTHELKKFLKPFEMEFIKEEGALSHSENIRVGGDPFWLQDAEANICSCGSEMKLICQVPENFAFEKLTSAPEQPDSFSSDDYCLFLGNETYIFGCVSQCSERAVKVVVQG